MLVQVYNISWGTHLLTVCDGLYCICRLMVVLCAQVRVYLLDCMPQVLPAALYEAAAVCATSPPSFQWQRHLNSVHWILLTARPDISAHTLSSILKIPNIPSQVAIMLAVHGIRVTYKQLVDAAANRVAGVDVWLHTHNCQPKGVPHVARGICAVDTQVRRYVSRQLCCRNLLLLPQRQRPGLCAASQLYSIHTIMRHRWLTYDIYVCCDHVAPVGAPAAKPTQVVPREAVGLSLSGPAATEGHLQVCM